jgi:hypothetical protein
MFSNMFLKIITKKKYVRKHYINSQCFKEKHYFLISLILKKKKSTKTILNKKKSTIAIYIKM